LKISRVKYCGFRGIPDISYNADPFTSILVYLSFIPGQAGYYFIGGTSEGSPQWAGIIADADQMAGHPLGFLNPHSTNLVIAIKQGIVIMTLPLAIMAITIFQATMNFWLGPGCRLGITQG
jgi:subtilase family serine protease